VTDDVKRQPVDAGGVPAEWITAPGAAKERVIYFLHGGGYSGFRTQGTDIGVSLPDVPERVAHSGIIASHRLPTAYPPLTRLLASTALTKIMWGFMLEKILITFNSFF